MTIDNTSLDKKINEMSADITDTVNQTVAQPEIQAINEDKAPDIGVPVTDSVFTQDEPTLVAGKATMVEDILKKTLEKEGTKVEREVKVGPASQRPTLSPKEVMPTEPSIPNNPQPLNVKPVSTKKMEKAVESKTAVEATGAPPGLNVSKISTVPFDDESLRATIQSTAQDMIKDPVVKTRTVQSLYDAAIERGVPESMARSILQGEEFTSKVGDSKLATNLAGLIQLHDDSAKYLDQLMVRYTTEGLSDIDKLNLRQQLAYHDVILKQMSGVQTDVARSLNVFKRASETKQALTGPDLQALLDSTASESTLKKFADAYMASPGQSGKNKLIQGQKGLWNKIQDGLWYTLQSNMLNDVKTWSENLVGSITHGGLMTVEDVVAAQIGKLRTAVKGEEGYFMEDFINGLHGWRNGMLDGMESASKVIKTGERAGFKGEARSGALSAEAFSNTSVNIPFTSREIYRTGDLKDTFVGNTLDAAAFIQSIPFRALAGGDELVSGTMARMALHREASKFARSRLDELTNKGMSLPDAEKQVSEEVIKFVREQPADVYDNVEEVRKMVSFSYDFNKANKLDMAYIRANEFLQLPIIRTMVPFSNTLTKIFDQGASRIPGMNFLSPQYHKDMARGGIYKDRAMARLSVGTTVGALTAYAANDGFITGSGPTDLELKTAMQNTGWQEYSFAIPTGQISAFVKEQLGKYTDVREANGKVYISYKRFDQIAQIMAAGADFSDAMKFSQEDPNSDQISNWVGAIAGTNAEYLTNLPTMQFVSEILSLSRGKFEDGGQKLLDVVEALGRQGVKNLTMSVPIAGVAVSTQASRVARLIDRPSTTKLPDEMMVGSNISTMATRAYQQAKNEVLGRIPIVRGQVEQELDDAGRQKYAKNTVIDMWINATPFISATKTQISPMDEVLAENRTGISRASKTWDGVSLSAEQFNTYKKLYGQDIKLPVYSMMGDELGNMNMEKAIPAIMKDLEKNRKNEGLAPMAPDDKRKEITRIVDKYRKEAKKVMIGDIQRYNPNLPENEDYGAKYSGIYYDENNEEKKSKYPDLVEAINKQKDFVRFSINPR